MLCNDYSTHNDTNVPNGTGATSAGLNPSEYFSRMRKECGHWKQLALANLDNPKLCRRYAAEWNKALALFKQRFHILITDTM